MSDNKDREALARVIASNDGEHWEGTTAATRNLYLGNADAVLAAGFRRAPIEDAEPRAVTDEMVEAGARALYSASWEVLGAFSGEEPCTWEEFKDKGFFRTDARIVLEALAKGGAE